MTRWPLVLALAMPAALSAQTTAELRAGVAFPRGAFADRSGPRAGSATTGFAFGGEVLFPLRGAGFDATISLDVLLTPMDPDPNTAPLTGQDGTHTTIPLMAGVRWTNDVSSGMAWYVSGHAGVGIYNPPSLDSYDFDPLTKVAFGLGAGAVLRDRIVLGVRLLPIGEYEVHDEFGGDMVVSGEFDVSLIALTFGVRF